MHSAEGVGYVQLRHGGKLLGKGGVVLLLPDVEAQVLQQHDLTALQCRGLRLGILAHDVLGENDLLPQQLAETLGDGGETQLALPLTLGLAQMGAGDDRRAVVQQIADGGQSRHDALVAGDGSRLLVLGYVKVAAQQHFFALNVHILYRLFIVIHEIHSSLSNGITLPPSLPVPSDRESRSAATPHR